MNIKENEISKRYCTGLHLNGIIEIKINEAYKQLQYDLDSLHTVLKDKTIGDKEYCRYKIKSMEYFNENLLKAAREFRVGQNELPK